MAELANAIDDVAKRKADYIRQAAQMDFELKQKQEEVPVTLPLHQPPFLYASCY
jgi:hypothetical protein